MLSCCAADSGFADFLADCNANLAMLEFQIRRILFPVRPPLSLLLHNHDCWALVYCLYITKELGLF